MLANLPEISSSSHGLAQGISLREIVFTLYRRKWIILAISIPITLVGSLNLLRQTGSYTAGARIVVELNEVEQPRWNTRTSNINYDIELSTLFNIAMSVPVVREAATSLQDSIPVIQEAYPELTNLNQAEELESFLWDHMDVTVVGESRILESQFNSLSPRVSLMCVEALRNSFMDFYTNKNKGREAQDYYNEQIEFVRAQIDSILIERTKVMEATGYTSIKDDLRYETGQLADLENDLFAAITVSAQLEAQYQRLSASLEGDPRDFPMGDAESRSGPLNYYWNIVSRHTDQLNQLLAIHTPESVPVQRQRELLEMSLADLAKHQRNYTDSIHLELMTSRKKEASLRMLAEQVRERNRRGPAAYHRIELFDSELASLRELLESLQGKLGEVRLSENADERISNLIILSDPEIVEVVTGSQTAIFLVMVVMLALALGLVVAFIVEALDHRVFTPTDIEENLKLPVFASISRTK